VANVKEWYSLNPRERDRIMETGEEETISEGDLLGGIKENNCHSSFSPVADLTLKQGGETL